MKISTFLSFFRLSRHLKSSGVLVNICSDIFYTINIIIFIITAFNKLAYTYFLLSMANKKHTYIQNVS